VSAGSGPPPIGKFLVFAYYTVLIFPNLSQIGEAWPMINDARAALSRIRANTGAGHLPEPGAQAALPSPEELHPRFGAIVFDHVTLRNDRGEMILDDVHFRIEPGEKVALAGESGTGKTSLLSLLLGLQKPTEGRVSINGRDVTTLSLADLKRFFVFARAQPAFVPGTLQDNIALHKSPDQERVADTLDRSRLASRVAVDPAGMHAHVGDKGEPFSAGEQQRIAFARVMLADPPCLIFDEALNSLDEESELWITRRMIAELDDKTVIAVSHRKSAAKLFPKRLEIVRGGKVGWVEG
jgi:ABC-type multidrug transport system fused ATPase/permease subunit